MSEVGACFDLVGYTGIKTGTVEVSLKNINRIIKRSNYLYKEILGWSEDEIKKRTLDLARSCTAMGKEIKRLFPEGIMVFTENIYESGILYNGNEISTNPIPIFYPKKDNFEVVQ